MLTWAVSMLLISGLVSVLVSVVSTEDDFAHTAMDRVPATLGDDVQIRCTKIITKEEYDYMDSTFCDPEYDRTCYHVWRKPDGSEISSTNAEKFVLKNTITYDYCENFEWTSDLVKQFGGINDNADDDYNNYYEQMKCFSSSLTIRNVVREDLGVYQCHFGDRAENVYDKHRKQDPNQIQSIEVFDAASPLTQEPKIEYFESFYVKKMAQSMEMLMQCVVTGGTLAWYFALETGNCSPNHDQPCEKGAMHELADIATLDMWRCFQFRVHQHSPHSGITESLVFFQNICSDDWANVFCGVKDTELVSKGETVAKAADWGNYWWYYDLPNMALQGALFVAVPCLIVFFITGGIMAAVRGKVCNSCCRNPSFQVNHPYYQPVFRYHNAPMIMPVAQLPGAMVPGAMVPGAMVPGAMVPGVPAAVNTRSEDVERCDSTASNEPLLSETPTGSVRVADIQIHSTPAV